MKTKIYCDTADLNVIRKFNKKKIVKGFTTNPSLMRKAGAINYEKYSKKILNIANKKPVSLEVFGDDHSSMKNQALKIRNWGPNVFVKVPIINSKNKFMGKLIQELNEQKIKLNITAVYSFKQTKKIIKCIKNKKIPVIISIFAGRASDAGKDPIPDFTNSIRLVKKFKNIKILWASVREPYNYIQAKNLDCDIITIPPSIIEMIERFGKSYKFLTRETVKKFLLDSKKSKFRI